jgi:hypothetical protein
MNQSYKPYLVIIGNDEEIPKAGSEGDFWFWVLKDYVAGR